jgi:hypothetical protein
MRLKENKDSWHSHVITKRDFRHDQTDLNVAYRSHKNTNRWCRGRVGINHEINWQRETWMFGIIVYVGKCTACGKQKTKLAC